MLTSFVGTETSFTIPIGKETGMKQIENFSFLAFFLFLPNILTVFGDDFFVHKGRKRGKTWSMRGASRVGRSRSIDIDTAASSPITARTGPRP